MHTIVPVVVYLFCYILLTAYCKPTHDVFFHASMSNSESFLQEFLGDLYTKPFDFSN